MCDVWWLSNVSLNQKSCKNIFFCLSSNDDNSTRLNWCLHFVQISQFLLNTVRYQLKYASKVFEVDWSFVSRSEKTRIGKWINEFENFSNSFILVLKNNVARSLSSYASWSCTACSYEFINNCDAFVADYDDARPRSSRSFNAFDV